MLKPLQISEDIVPLNEFKAKASHLLKAIHASGRPLVITQNGRPAAVMMTPREYDQLSERGRLLKAIQEGEADMAAGRVVDDSEVDEDLGG